METSNIYHAHQTPNNASPTYNTDKFKQIQDFLGKNKNYMQQTFSPCNNTNNQSENIYKLVTEYFTIEIAKNPEENKNSTFFADIVFKDGSKYKGKIGKDGELIKGEILFPDCSYYDGTFNENLPEGQGITQNSFKNFHKTSRGSWKKGKREGFGFDNICENDLAELTQKLYRLIIEKIKNYSNESEEISGLLSQIIPNEMIENLPFDILESIINKLSKNEKTTEIFSKYESEAMSELSHEIKSKSNYIGFFENNMRHGNGKETTYSGIVYQGNWNNNVKEGKGAMIFKDGSKIEAKWKNNELQNGEVTISIPDGNRSFEGKELPAYITITGNLKNKTLTNTSKEEKSALTFENNNIKSDNIYSLFGRCKLEGELNAFMNINHTQGILQIYGNFTVDNKANTQINISYNVEEQKPILSKK